MSHLTVKTLNKNKYFKIKPTYAITVGKLHKKLQAMPVQLIILVSMIMVEA